MCLTTSQVDKATLDGLFGDCPNRPSPPNRPGPLEDSPADPNKGDTGSVIIPPYYKPQSLPSVLEGKLLESLIIDIWP